MSVYTSTGRSYDSAGRWRTDTYTHTGDAAAVGDALYIVGDEFTDGSVRLIFTAGDDVAHVEARADGVWNDTGFRFASSSVEVGRDLTISAAAGFMETNNPSALVGHVKSLIPHIEFDDDGSRQVQTPILAEETIVVVYGNAVGETNAKSIGIDLGQVPSRLIEHSFHEVGTVGAVDDVEVSIYVGTDNTGVLINRRILPASQLPAKTQLDINYDNDLGFEGGSNIFMEFVSDTSFTLETDVAGNPVTTHEMHELSTIEILTENLIFNNALGHVLDNSLNPVYENQF